LQNFRISMQVNGERFETLADILPDSGSLDILIISKAPAPISVEAGHYFQGRQGQVFWKRLKQAGILTTKPGEYEDEALLRHRIGLMDIVKKPKGYGNEPTIEEYRQGIDRIMHALFTYQPQILIFVYKKVLDQLLKHGLREKVNTNYGFNDHLEHLFKAKVFVFPMPGTPCSKEVAEQTMEQLIKEYSALTKSS